MKLRPNPAYRWILREDGGYIYSPIDHSIKVLNVTGSFIVRNCEGCDIDQLIAEMADEFDCPSVEVLREDVAQFIQTMIGEGYLCQNE